MTMLAGRVQKEFLKACETIRTGRLTVITPEGRTFRFGHSGVNAEIEIYDWSAITAALTRGDVGLGEAYIEGLWETPNLEDLITLALRNLDQFENFAYAGAYQGMRLRLVDRVLRANSRRGASRNIRAHYDVGNEFFQLWLDPTMTYSSGLFAPGDDDLRAAQLRKYDRILDRLGTADNMLELGCGWGGFAERAARQGRHVTGVTISPSQKGYADARLDGQADIRLSDYRDVEGGYDAIVSIEMIEAVGERYWPAFFQVLQARLNAGGRVMLQAITVPDAYFRTYRRSSDFIRQHVFPGGMLLSKAEIDREAQGAGLKMENCFSFGPDYAKTCRIWLQRLEAQTAKVSQLGYSERFMRSWRFYLGICAASFAVGQTDVVQVELRHQA